MRKHQLGVDLSQRTKGLKEELAELTRVPARLSLGDIRRHRDSGTLQLACQSRSLAGGKRPGDTVDFLRQRYPLLQHNQGSVIPDAHVPLRGPPGLRRSVSPR